MIRWRIGVAGTPDAFDPANPMVGSAYTKMLSSAHLLILIAVILTNLFIGSQSTANKDQRSVTISIKAFLRKTLPMRRIGLTAPSSGHGACVFEEDGAGRVFFLADFARASILKVTSRNLSNDQQKSFVIIIFSSCLR
jgi:hypothetical protein